MDDAKLAKIQELQDELVENFTKLGGLVNELRASVNVLKLRAAIQISPDSPELALAKLEEMEKELLKTSEDEQERLRGLDLIQTMKEWKKKGTPSGSA